MAKLAGRDIETCWLCGKRPADTREHRLLKARLDLIYGGRNGIVTTSPYHRPTIMGGTKSIAAKFGRSMCQKCNGHITQPWDAAYLRFVASGLLNANLYRYGNHLSWANIFPNESGPQPNLSRYYAKNVGCRLIDRYRKVPQSLRSYLNLEMSSSPFSLFLVKDYDWLDEMERLLGSRWDYPTLKFNYTEQLGRDGSPQTIIALYHEGPYAVVFLMNSEQFGTYNFAHEHSFHIHSRSELPELVQGLWKIVDDKIDTLQKFEANGRLQEVVHSPDFLNTLGTHDQLLPPA